MDLSMKAREPRNHEFAALETSKVINLTPTCAPKASYKQKSLSEGQRMPLQGARGDSKIDGLGSNEPSHGGLHVQEHTNMSKTCTWITFCFPRETSGSIKSSDFVKDILKKSQIPETAFTSHTKT